MTQNTRCASVPLLIVPPPLYCGDITDSTWICEATIAVRLYASRQGIVHEKGSKALGLLRAKAIHEPNPVAFTQHPNTRPILILSDYLSAPQKASKWPAAFGGLNSSWESIFAGSGFVIIPALAGWASPLSGWQTAPPASAWQVLRFALCGWPATGTAWHPPAG